MSRTVRVTPVRVAVAGGLLATFAALAGTGGAVAATLVTSADIADHTIKARDVDQTTLKTFTRLQGYTIVTNQVVVPAGSDGNLIGTCPGDSRALGATAFWDGRVEAVETVYLSDGTGALALVQNPGAEDTLTIRVACAQVY